MKKARNPNQSIHNEESAKVSQEWWEGKVPGATAKEAVIRVSNHLLSQEQWWSLLLQIINTGITNSLMSNCGGSKGQLFDYTGFRDKLKTDLINFFLVFRKPTHKESDIKQHEQNVKSQRIKRVSRDSLFPSLKIKYLGWWDGSVTKTVFHAYLKISI